MKMLRLKAISSFQNWKDSKRIYIIKKPSHFLGRLFYNPCDPFFTQRQQAFLYIDGHIRIGIRTAGIVYGNGVVLFHFIAAVEFMNGIRKYDFAHGYFDVVDLSGHINFL